MIIKFFKLFRKRILMSFRYLDLRIQNPNLKVGFNFFCGKGCSISRKNNIAIGDNFYMGNYCNLAADCIIGNDVLFGSNVSLVGGDHRIDNIPGLIKDSGRDQFKTINIRNNVWIGHGVLIMHGICIKSGAVIAAGSVLTKDVPENAIFGGNPAKLIRMRKMVDE